MNTGLIGLKKLARSLSRLSVRRSGVKSEKISILVGIPSSSKISALRFWAVALLTGMRSGELHALGWNDIDLDNKIIRITKSFNPHLRGIKSTKNSDWRNAHVSSDLENVLIELKNERGHEEFVLPHLTGWDGGYAGTILRDFLKSIGIEKYVNFHTLRACFATHVLASGAEPTQVMKMGGWSDFKTFQIYVRMAGVDVKGVTDNFKVMPKVFGEENVLKIR